MSNVIKKIKRVARAIKMAVVSIASDDTLDNPIGTAQYNGKTTKYMRWSPYGLDSNPPVNSLLLLLSNGAQESLKFGIASDIKNRKASLTEGEVALYNTLSQNTIYLKADGAIEITSTDANGSNQSSVLIDADGLLNITNQNGVSLYTILSNLILEIKALQTIGSPTSHTVSTASQSLLDAVQSDIDGLLK